MAFGGAARERAVGGRASRLRIQPAGRRLRRAGRDRGGVRHRRGSRCRIDEPDPDVHRADRPGSVRAVSGSAVCTGTGTTGSLGRTGGRPLETRPRVHRRVRRPVASQCGRGRLHRRDRADHNPGRWSGQYRRDSPAVDHGRGASRTQVVVLLPRDGGAVSGNHRLAHHPRQFVPACRRRGGGADHQRRHRCGAGPHAAGALPRIRAGRRRPDHDADRPDPGDRTSRCTEHGYRWTRSTTTKSTRHSPRYRWPGRSTSAPTRPGSTPAAAPSHWAIRSVPQEPGC